MNFENVSKGTWVRTIILAISIINQILRLMGIETLPFTGEEVAEVASSVLILVASAWAWWKNNSFTKKAQEADKQLKGIN